VITVAAGLSASQKTGLSLVAGVFIIFALTSSMLVPRRWPDFPTPGGLKPFLAASAALFAGMILAVIFIARESKEEERSNEPPAAAVSPGATASAKFTRP
jgi:hypothetical protein